MNQGTAAYGIGRLVIAVILVGCCACSPGGSEPDSPDPASKQLRAERDFSEAERLRLLYVEESSRTAIERYRSALELFAELGDSAGAARASAGIGLTYFHTGGLEAALGTYGEALGFSRKAKDPELESEILSDAGFVHSMLGNLERASEMCLKAQTIAARSASARGEAKALSCLAEVHYHQGGLEQALEFHRRAEDLWRRLGDRRGQATSLLYLGTVHSDLSQLDQAEACYAQAEDLWAELDDRRGRAQVLVARGLLHDRLGEYQQALNSYSQSMELVEPMGDAVWLGSLVGGIGSIYLQMADYPNALAYWTEALELYRAADLPTARIDALMTLGEIRLASGEDALALERFRQTLAACEELGDQRLTSYALNDIGLVHLSMGEPLAALGYYQRALDIGKATGDRRLEAYARGDIGVVHLELGDSNEALKNFQQALELSRSAGDRLGEAAGLFNVARAEGALGNLWRAREHLESTLRAAESLRSDVDSHLLRSSYFASIQHYYESYIDILMRLHRSNPAEALDAVAFRASERARARTLLESLGEARVDLRHGVDPDLLRREKELKRQLDAASSQQMRGPSGDGAQGSGAESRDDLRELTVVYDQVQAEIRSKSPRYAALMEPQPLTLEIVQDEILDHDTLVLEYSLGEERSYLWAVERQRHASYELPPRATIELAAKEVYELLTARLPVPGESVRTYRQRVEEADVRYWDSASRLTDMLLAPVATRLPGKRIVVIADGALQYLPFSALPSPEGTDTPYPMIVGHEIVSLPSVSALSMLRADALGRTTPDRSVAVLADPVFETDDPRVGSPGTPLEDASQQMGPGSGDADPKPEALRALHIADPLRGAALGMPRLVATRREAQAILAVAPKGTTLQAFDFEASRERALSPELGAYRIVHFATHGIVNNEQPGLSAIVLSMVDAEGHPQNGLLRLDDIYNLELPADLIVLSACNSALGKPVNGEGLVGMVRGFMYAGAQRVVASLWKVDDEATGELMRHFYREMLQAGRSPADALREAQLAMWRDEQWRAPFYWAAFVLQGEWR